MVGPAILMSGTGSVRGGVAPEAPVVTVVPPPGGAVTTVVGTVVDVVGTVVSVVAGASMAARWRRFTAGR